jgi:hypothetical protein
MNTVLCIFMLATPLKSGKVWRDYPMLEGSVLKQEGEQSYVDFAIGLSKIKYNKQWNNQVRWVRSNDCISSNSTN